MQLTEKERKTYRLHITYSVLEGILEGVLLLNTFILAKSLLATSFQVSVVYQTSICIMVFSLFLNEYIKRIGNTRKLLTYIALLTRLPFLLFLLIPANSIFIASNLWINYLLIVFFFIIYLSNPVVYPIINMLLRHNYTEKNFSRLYGYASQFKRGASFVTILIVGAVLDYNNFAFKYIYPLVSLMGIVGILMLSKIESPKLILTSKETGLLLTAKNAVSRFTEVFKNNKTFLHFEIGFMIYGFGWMISYPLLAVFFQNELHLNYSSVSFYNDIYLILAILLLPFFGKMIQKHDPRRYGMFVFSTILFFFLFAGLTQYFNFGVTIGNYQIMPVLIIAFVFHGLFTASQTILFGIGSSFFASKEEAGNYQSIHLTCQGIRACIAPLLGVMLYHKYGFSFIFGLSIILLSISIVVMYISVKKEPITK